MVHPLRRLRASARCHLLTLDGRSNLPVLRRVDQITLSACTLYLVFKEPEAQPDSTASLHRSAAIRASPRFPRFQPQGVVFGGTFQDYRPNQPLSSLNFTCGRLCPSTYFRLGPDRPGNWLTRKGPPLLAVALRNSGVRSDPLGACSNHPANLRIVGRLEPHCQPALSLTRHRLPVGLARHPPAPTSLTR
jgi:hypothetical protein